VELFTKASKNKGGHRYGKYKIQFGAVDILRTHSVQVDIQVDMRVWNLEERSGLKKEIWHCYHMGHSLRDIRVY
jgi:hypothetical protein